MLLFNLFYDVLGEERANLSVFVRMFNFTLAWFCLFPLRLEGWEVVRFVIMALPVLFSYILFITASVNCRVAAAKRLRVLQYSVHYIFF